MSVIKHSFAPLQLQMYLVGIFDKEQYMTFITPVPFLIVSLTPKFYSIIQFRKKQSRDYGKTFWKWNVIEIDAASNNGVDNIREIVEEVKYSPTEGKYKVYIIDEVQYAPNLFSYIKIDVDEHNEKGKYWLTGSQKFELMKNVTSLSK